MKDILTNRTLEVGLQVLIITRDRNMGFPRDLNLHQIKDKCIYRE